jgi:predicted cupin superfamily sugar epimerase
MLTADKLKELLGLHPHPIEGGYFAETYRSEAKLPPGLLGSTHPGERLLATAIFYLLTPDTFSAMHRLPGDELFHFYLGDPVEMLQVAPDGSGQTILLGQEIEAGMLLQHNVPGNHWQGSRLVAGGRFALLGTTMSPGFDYVDYVTGRHAELCAQFPRFAEMITQLTR